MGQLPGAMSDKKRKRDKAGKDAGIQETDLVKLKDFMAEEETKLRTDVIDRILNDEILVRITACKTLSERSYTFKSYAEMREADFVTEVRAELQECFRLASTLEGWLNTSQPPLSCGGSAAVSSEVQDGIFGSMHSLSAECTESLMRMFALEKDRALMKTKLTDEETWLRYEVSLDNNQMHDVRKTTMNVNANIMSVANVIANNISHLTNWKDAEKHGGNMMF